MAHGAVDPLAYHLALPSIYLAKHDLSFECNPYWTLYPDNIDVVYGRAHSARRYVSSGNSLVFLDSQRS